MPPPPASCGDPTFDDAFDDLAAVAYRVAFRLTGSRSEAEDIAQEALARTFSRWRRVRHHAEPWVARVAANLALDSLRRARRRPTGELVAEPAAPAGRVSAAERLELVRLLGQLPRRQREVVVLRYLADLSEADTARELGTSVGTVKTHASRGIAALRAGWVDVEVDVEVDVDPDPRVGSSGGSLFRTAPHPGGT